MSRASDVTRFDRKYFNVRSMRKAAQTKEGMRFLVDTRASQRMQRDQFEAYATAQLAEHDAFLRLFADVLDREKK